MASQEHINSLNFKPRFENLKRRFEDKCQKINVPFILKIDIKMNFKLGLFFEIHQIEF